MKVNIKTRCFHLFKVIFKHVYSEKNYLLKNFYFPLLISIIITNFITNDMNFFINYNFFIK